MIRTRLSYVVCLHTALQGLPVSLSTACTIDRYLQYHRPIGPGAQWQPHHNPAKPVLYLPLITSEGSSWTNLVSVRSPLISTTQYAQSHEFNLTTSTHHNESMPPPVDAVERSLPRCRPWRHDKVQRGEDVGRCPGFGSFSHQSNAVPPFTHVRVHSSGASTWRMGAP